MNIFSWICIGRKGWAILSLLICCPAQHRCKALGPSGHSTNHTACHIVDIVVNPSSRMLQVSWLHWRNVEMQVQQCQLNCLGLGYFIFLYCSLTKHKLGYQCLLCLYSLYLLDPLGYNKDSEFLRLRKCNSLSLLLLLTNHF